METALHFISTWPGMYLVQCLLHSVVAAVVSDAGMVAWRVADARRTQAMRMSVIVLPVLMYPAFQAIDPARGSLYTRPSALFDAFGWLALDLWGRLPVLVPVLAVLGLTALVFALQELLPIVIHTARSLLFRERDETGEATDTEGGPDDDIADWYARAVSDALDGLPGPLPEVSVVEDAEPVVYSSTGRTPAVFVSTGFVDAFSPAELRGAIAHELGHVRRSRKPVLIVLFVLRMLMFFNPVTLFEFRKVVQEEEKICDDEAVALTGDPASMASALRRLMDAESGVAGGTGGMMESVERHSQDMQISERIVRLDEYAPPPHGPGAWVPVGVSAAATVALCYFIV